MTSALGAHFFRHEYGRLVASLSRRVGVHHLELVEDAVQAALLTAVECWSRAELPENPPAWLYRVAGNHLLGELRRRARRAALLDASAGGEQDPITLPEEASLCGEVPDSLLRMLFVCCDPAIAPESQLVLALKTLCGFDIPEIAQRLFTSEASVYKRLARARKRLREARVAPEDSSTQQLLERLPAVQAILYTLFTEGYLSHGEAAIRRELCDEALRLTALLAAHPAGARPETFALLALMHLHTARFSARQDGSGGLLLLEEQDRSRFDQQQLACGLTWLARSAGGTVFSRYHCEAGIAAEHCLAPSFAETRWERIVECYELLDRVAPSAIHTLNRAIAVAELRGAREGLAVLEAFAPPAWLAGSFVWSAVLADLYRRCGHSEHAQRHRQAALALAPTAAVRAALQRRLG
ncbi:MAG: sigma-70 family RNA polymerase sigma factor [Myxococcota bacterium]|nr:sigma-70 family RNA polymerase sigma factor [Myxococcota bacterium]